MAEEKKEEKKQAQNKTDPWFDKIAEYVSGRVATFVAFLFFLITLGAIYAVIITKAPLTVTTTLLILAPALVGLVAYANRDWAVIFFALFLILIIFI